MNIFYLQNIFYEHSKNEKFNYLQTVKIDSSTYSPHLKNGVPSFHVEVCEDSNIFKIVLLASDCNLSSSVDSEREVMHCTLSFQSDKGL